MALPAAFYRFKAIAGILFCTALIALPVVFSALGETREASPALRALGISVVFGILWNLLAVKIAVAAHFRGAPARPAYLFGTALGLCLLYSLLRSSMTGPSLVGAMGAQFESVKGLVTAYGGVGFLVGCMVLEVRRAFRKAALEKPRA